MRNSQQLTRREPALLAPTPIFRLNSPCQAIHISCFCQIWGTRKRSSHMMQPFRVGFQPISGSQGVWRQHLDLLVQLGWGWTYKTPRSGNKHLSLALVKVANKGEPPSCVCFQAVCNMWCSEQRGSPNEQKPTTQKGDP